jgi:hypothetical protein
MDPTLLGDLKGMEALLGDLKGLESSIQQDEESAIRARWDYGRRICEFYALKPYGENKQLPNGELEKLATALDVDRSEVNARMKFAKVYRTDDELSTVVESFRSWSAIKQHGLTDTSRVRPQPKTAFRRAFDIVQNIDARMLTADDVALIAPFLAKLAHLEQGTVVEQPVAA